MTGLTKEWNPRDCRFSVEELDWDNLEFANSKLDDLLKYAVRVQQYSETPNEILSFNTWFSRRQDYWAAALLGGGKILPFYFTQWIRQGSLSLASELNNLDPNKIIQKAKRHKFVLDEELSSQEKIEKYWYKHACTKWMFSILSVYEKGTVNSFFSAALSELIKDQCAKPYLKFMEKIGIDGVHMARTITESLIKRRLRKNDKVMIEVFRTDLNGQQLLPYNGQGKVVVTNGQVDESMKIAEV